MTDQFRQTNPNDHKYSPDDGIELMDYLLVIWKWKYLILAGTAICALIAFLISFTAAINKYRINMILKPAIKNLDKSGNEVYIDSPKIMKFLIEGELKYEILNRIKSSKEKSMPNSFDVELNVPTGQNLLYLTYETINAGIGLKKIQFLLEALQNKYTEKIEIINKEYEKEIRTKQNHLSELIYRINNKLHLKKNKLINHKNMEKILVKDIDTLEDRLETMTAENLLIRKNTEKLINERKSLILKKDQVDSLRSIILSNITQQNMNLSNSFQNQMVNYIFTKNQKEQSLYNIRNQIEDIKNEISEIEKSMSSGQSKSILDPTLYDLVKQVKDIKLEIEELKEEKKNIKTIQIIKAPTTTQLVENNRRKILKVSTATTVVFFLLVFVAFFLEYLQNYKKSKKQS